MRFLSKTLALTLLFAALVLTSVKTNAVDAPQQIQLSQEEITQILSTPEKQVFIGSEASDILTTFRTVAALAQPTDTIPALKALDERLQKGYKTTSKENALAALRESEQLLETHHAQITDDTQVKSLAQQLDNWHAVIAADDLTVMIGEPQERRAPRPGETSGVETEAIPSDEGDDVCCELPRDVYVERDLTVGGNALIEGDLTVNGTIFGTITLVGPVTIGVGPCDTNVLFLNGSESLNGNIDFTTNPSTATCGNILKNGTRFIHNFGSATNTFLGGLSGNFSSTTAAFNTGVGGTALSALTTGQANTAIGYGALNATTNGTNNVGMGVNAGNLSTSGTGNILLGAFAGQNTNGVNNVAIGYTALQNSTSGNNNFALGAGALGSAGFTGASNVCIGNAAGFAYTASESNNIVIGVSLLGTATENNVIRIGNGSAKCFVAGITGVDVVTPAQLVVVNGSNQLGTSSAGGISITGPLTVGAGPCTATVLTVNGTESINGNIDLTTNPSTLTCGSIFKNGQPFIHNYSPSGVDFSNIFVGQSAGNLSATYPVGANAAFGVSALNQVTSGNGNTAIGFNTLPNTTSGIFNLALGHGGGTGLGAGDSVNILIGAAGVGGDNNTIRIGSSGAHTRAFVTGITGVDVVTPAQLVVVNGSNQLGTSSAAGISPITISAASCDLTALTINGSESITGNIDFTTNPSTLTCGIIEKAGSSFIHNYPDATNVSVGLLDTGNLDIANVGSHNSAFGTAALTNVTSGTDNTTVGYNTLTSTTGNNNVAVGASALSNGLLTSGSSNTALGFSAGNALTTSDSNNILINHAGVAGDNGRIRIGTALQQTEAFIQGISGVPLVGAADIVVINAAGQLGTSATTINPITISAASCDLTALTINGSESITGNIDFTTNPSTLTCGIIEKAGSSFIHNYPDATNVSVGLLDTGNLDIANVGIHNSAFGTSALINVTTGINNTTVGYNTLTIDTGNNNVAVGAGALSNGALTSGSSNTALGFSAGNALTTSDSDNILINHAGVAGDNDRIRIGTLGTQTTAFIQGISGVPLVGAADIVVIDAAGQLGTAATAVSIASPLTVGAVAGLCSTTVLTVNGTESITGNIIFTTDPSTATCGSIFKNGTSFIHNAGINNTFVGKGAGNFTLGGDCNVGVGDGALDALTTGAHNVGMGCNALGTNLAGLRNVAIGHQALLLNTADDNVAVGAFALDANTTGTSNIAIGTNALGTNNIGGANIAIGFNALVANTDGAENIAIGSGTLLDNTSGVFNIGIGDNALANNTLGVNNIAIGVNTLDGNLTGDRNIAIGTGAIGDASFDANDNIGIGNATLTSITTGTNNISLGSNSGAALTLADSNNISIANAGVAGESGAIRIGTNGAHTDLFLPQRAVLQAYTTHSLYAAGTQSTGSGTGFAAMKMIWARITAAGLIPLSGQSGGISSVVFSGLNIYDITFDAFSAIPAFLVTTHSDPMSSGSISFSVPATTTTVRVHTYNAANSPASSDFDILIIGPNIVP